MDEAGHGLQCRALADTVAPEKADHLPSADFQRHTVQNVALAVVGVNLLDLEEGLREVRAHVFR
jgi:hypothetical protein